MEGEMIKYKYLAEVLKREIVSGKWGLREKLPSVKELAKRYDVNSNTMQRTLANLEKEGLIFSRRTSGKFVTDNKILLASVRGNEAHKLASEFVSDLKAIGVSPDELVSMLSNPEIPYSEEI